MAAEWATVAPRLGDLEQLHGADRHLVGPLREYIRARSRPVDGFLTVVVPRTCATGPWCSRSCATGGSSW